MLRRIREPINSISHFLGAFLALIGGLWLIAITYPSVPRMIVSGVYSLTMFGGFMASAVMHSYIGERKIIRWLIRLDHAGIFLMIAGSYTPFAYEMLGGSWRWLVLGAIWVIGLGGAAWKLLTWKKDTIWQTLSYFIMVIVAFFMLPDVLPKLPAMGLSLLILGSVMYIVGAVVFAAKRPNFNEHWGYHEIWHLFVLAGAASHFFSIAWYVLG